MDEQTVRGWLKGLQDRFDTLFETLAQQRVAFFQQQHDAFEALFGDENNQTVDTIAGDQKDPDVKDKQENQDDPNIAIPDKVLEESHLHTSDKVEVMPTRERMRLQDMVTGRSYQGIGRSPDKVSLEWMSDSHAPLVADIGRRKSLKCYIQGSGRRKKTKGVDSERQDCTFFWSLSIRLSQFWIWDPGIKSVFPDITLRER
ncbi:hypothetical protein Tco_0927640 [Tanacetum coccineum]